MDDLVSYRIENAREKLESSKILLDAGHYKDSIGRSYYSIFTGVRAVLAKDGIDFQETRRCHSVLLERIYKNRRI